MRHLISALLLLLLFAYCHSQCADQTHYHYKCPQLAKYCKYPQAVRIRKSCPVTCGLCPTAGRFQLSTSGRTRRPTTRRTTTTTTPRTTTTTTTTSAPPRRRTPAPFQSRNDQAVPFVVRKNLGRGGRNRPPFEVLDTPSPRLPVVRERTAAPTPRRNLRPISPVEVRTQPAVNSGQLAQLGSRQSRPAGGQTGSLRQTEIEAQAFHECCLLNSISASCQALCNYAIQADQILQKAVSGQCSMADADVWMRCASGGRQNGACCARSGVFGCDQLCDGKFSVTELLRCVSTHLKPILKCHRNNLIK